MVAELLRCVGWRDDEHFEWQLLQLYQLQPDQPWEPDSQQDFLWHQDFRLAGWAWPVFRYQPGCLVALQHGFSPVSKMQKG